MYINCDAISHSAFRGSRMVTRQIIVLFVKKITIFGGERVHGENSHEQFRLFIVLSRSRREEKERKSERWMPWLWEATKDVVSCDKLRVGANDL